MLDEILTLLKHKGPVVTPELITDSPCFCGRKRSTVHYLGICKQPEQAKLSDPAECETIRRCFLKPALRHGMMLVTVNRKCNPDIYVR